MPRADILSPRGADSAPIVVVDNGSGLIKTGFAGEEEPRGLLPTWGLTGAGDVRPLKNGVVQDWDTMEAYWDYAFTHQLGIDTERCKLLVTASLFETKDNKERLMQTLFESFAAPAVFSSPPPVFELYASGRENGVVLGIGAQCSYAVVMHEGLHDARTQLRSGVAGEALDDWVARLLQKGGAQVDASTAREVKEKLGVVSASMNVADASYELPDGKQITVTTAQRAQMADPLFDPTLMDEAGGGLSQLVGDCIKLRDRDGVLQSEVHGKDGTALWFQNIVLAGGSSLFNGMADRLQVGRGVLVEAGKGLLVQSFGGLAAGG